VQQTFVAIGSLLSEGSRVLVDFLQADVADGSSSNQDALEKARRVASLGEPWVFGVAPDLVGEFVKHFGLDLVKLYDAGELWARYAPERKRPMDYVMIAVCEKN
jgi:O-methyltransferase involved in polyketide biosynthesis